VLDSALVMRNGVLEQQQIVDVCIVSELIWYQPQIYQ
jgi:hypothetical protein